MTSAAVMSPSLEVGGLGKTYRSVIALEDVNLSLGRGLCALLGPNGAGKTTLIRTVVTAQAPDSGYVRVCGLDPRAGLRRVRKLIGYVPQQLGLYPRFRVDEFVEYVAVLRGIAPQVERRAAVAKALAAVDLTPLASARVKTLSGGMRRRLGIAAGFVGGPPVLVMDEPFAGLDPEQRVQLREIIRTTASSSAVLVSTHQTEDVALVFDRVVVLDQGRIRFDGTPSDLAAHAEGRVWIGPSNDSSVAKWPTTDRELYRHIGDPPPRRRATASTLEDGYLLLLGRQAPRIDQRCTGTT